jgi:hypothetical protein
MIKAYIKSLDKKILLLMLFALIASPTLCGINTYTVCLIYSHYLCIYLNNLYLMLMYQQVDKLNLLNDLITVRIGTTKYYIYSYIQIIMIGIIYNLIIYICYYFFFGSIPTESVSLTHFYMIINVIVTCIENSIIYMQLGNKKRFSYLAIPIMMNLLFHLVFTTIF